MLIYIFVCLIVFPGSKRQESEWWILTSSDGDYWPAWILATLRNDWGMPVSVCVCVCVRACVHALACVCFRCRSCLFNILWFEMPVVIVIVVFHLSCLNVDIVYVWILHSLPSSVFYVRGLHFRNIVLLWSLLLLLWTPSMPQPVKFLDLNDARTHL